MKFIEFKKLVEEYKNLVVENKGEQAKELLKKLDPQNEGLKRFFVVKKFRVERVVENYCEANNLPLRYEIENATNKNYDFIIKIKDEAYKIKCRTKKAVGYIDLKCLYENVNELEGLNLLIKKHPKIVDGLWKTILDTQNETKCRQLVSLSMQISNNEKQLEYVNKEGSMIVQLIKQLKEERDTVKASLEEITVEPEHKVEV